MTSLATFVDRYTMKHVRIYPHPMERVWEAITNDERVSKWMGFEVHFPDLRVGATCTWGPLDEPYFTTEIIAFDPKTLIEHAGMRFELSPHPDGTKFEFTQSFPRGQTNEEWPDDLGGDLPGGLDTPWRPGFVGGFHASFDSLGRLLDGEDPDTAEPSDPIFGAIVDEWARQRVQQKHITQEQADLFRRQLRGVAQWNELNEIYRKHIRETIPLE
jgi:uncharacterized protein YndB with AHSA1/START domain